MNYFLLLIIAGLCGGGYYEYTLLQQSHQADQQQLADLTTKLSKLTSDNKQLADDKMVDEKSLNDAKMEIANLSGQAPSTDVLQKAIQGGNSAAGAVASQGSAAGGPVASSLGNLGTITTLDGKTYENCQVLKLNPDGLVISNPSGITEIKFLLMSPEMQKRFGYDPQRAAAQAAVQLQDAQKNATAPATAGN